MDGCVSLVPVSLGEQRQALADQPVAQQQDVPGAHPLVGQQAQDDSTQHGRHPVARL